MKKRVAVIGAGPSGIVTVKELLAEGHQPVCFERHDGPGGVFRFDERDGVIWEGARLTSSGVLTVFSDFPTSPDRKGHMLAGEYVEYLENYCSAFQLNDHIRYGHNVDSVEKTADGRWKVVTTDRGGQVEEGWFDAVAVCAGLHQHSHTPAFPGQEEFRGTLLHGSRYRRASQVAGKRVLVVGCGESGADIAAHVAEHARETVLSMRRGVSVVPRIMAPWRDGGVPNDYLTSRLSQSVPLFLHRTNNPHDEPLRRIYRRTALAFSLLLGGVLGVRNLVRDCVDGARSRLRYLLASRAKRAELDDMRREARERWQLWNATWQYIQALREESGGGEYEQFGTKSEAFIHAILKGKCKRTPGIQRFERDAVVFDDGSRFDPEIVLFCTGFETKLPFLDPALAEQPRYMNSIVPAQGAALCFVGFARPAYGAIPPIAELQARWFALLLSGKLSLPPEQEMARSIEQDAQRWRAQFRALPPGRLDHLVDYTFFCDRLAAIVGCKPTRQVLKKHGRRLMKKLFNGPFVTAQYRLCGPHAKPELAEQTILAAPAGLSSLDILIFRFELLLCRILARTVDPRFAPYLQLSNT